MFTDVCFLKLSSKRSWWRKKRGWVSVISVHNLKSSLMGAREPNKQLLFLAILFFFLFLSRRFMKNIKICTLWSQTTRASWWKSQPETSRSFLATDRKPWWWVPEGAGPEVALQSARIFYHSSLYLFIPSRMFALRWELYGGYGSAVHSFVHVCFHFTTQCDLGIVDAMTFISIYTQMYLVTDAPAYLS